MHPGALFEIDGSDARHCEEFVNGRPSRHGAKLRGSALNGGGSVCASYQGSRRVAHACQTTMGWKRSVVEQRSTATTALSNAFGRIQMRPDQRKTRPAAATARSSGRGRRTLESSGCCISPEKRIETINSGVSVVLKQAAVPG
jgi:hypothetical protein